MVEQKAGELAFLRGLMINETSYDTMFGRMAVEQGLCTDGEMSHSLEELESRRQANPVELVDLMIDLGYITPSQAERLRTGTQEEEGKR